MKPETKNQLPVGTRVCVYWSRAYNCLFPGTIEDLEDVVLDKDNMVQVLLDDGDRRQVELASVRMLPHDYSHVGKFAFIFFDRELQLKILKVHLLYVLLFLFA